MNAAQVSTRTKEQSDDAFAAFKKTIKRLNAAHSGDLYKRGLYYSALAEAVERGARCLGLAVGAVLVRDERVIGTGYNGTPTAVPNCTEGGCERCRSSDSSLTGQFYDLCVCVHAEQNAVASAARFAVATDDAAVYTTVQPCFGCLKELMQAGVKRIVFLDWWPGTSSPEREWVLPQYRALVKAFVKDGEGAFVRLELPEEQQADRTTRQLARRQELDALRERLGRTSPSV